MPRNKTRPDRWRQRERRDKILVVIDAEETERQYLEQFRGKSSPTIPHVKIVTKNKDPLTVVNHASTKTTTRTAEPSTVRSQPQES
ncbi:hypothetical protein [Glycomyces rhizosphaerae]|uniref:Uncharacterized protein n=1 Tax=Glycomyces rhizosphaerae TaxID=2054422 RepID=A0ABV7Q0R5_9ACTN